MLSRKERFSPLFLTIGLLMFLLASLSWAGSRECRWTGIEKVVAVGDLHGDYQNFIKILRAVKLVDDEKHWIGGKTHLVQTGDVMDRGPEARKILDLIMRLEEESRKAGGMVHMLIGNHEEMNITGIAIREPLYVQLSQFLSFLPPEYVEEQEKNIRNHFEKQASSHDDSTLPLEDGLRNYWAEMLKSSDEAKYLYTTSFNENYGKWVIEHNAVIMINKTIFVHGGISKKYSHWKLEDINELLRMELHEFRKALEQKQPLSFKPKLVYASDGPLWYRGLAQEDASFHLEVDAILKNLQADRMVIAHTPQKGSRIVSKDFMSRFNEKVWIIDTGISEAYGGFLSALIIENGEVRLWGGGQ